VRLSGEAVNDKEYPIGTIRTRGLFGCPYTYRGNGVWTPSSIVEFGKMFPRDTVPGFFSEVVFGEAAKKS
jgi:hypothetical protein